jgi:SAM-dependent methyltransferase
MTASSRVESAGPFRSFRDPDGVLTVVDGRPVRLLRRGVPESLSSFLASDAAARWVASGSLIATKSLDQRDLAALGQSVAFREIRDAESWAAVVLHDTVPFVSHPQEWTPGMLYAAAELTLDLASDLLADRRGLKDATPANVLFRGTQPVFVDVLSIEDRDPYETVWLPYAQFVRTFLLPLLLHRDTGLPLRALFTIGRDGIEPEDAFRGLSLRGRFRRPALSLVTLPVLLGHLVAQRTAAVRSRRVADADEARFVLGATLGHLRRALRRLAPPAHPVSEWTAYAGEHPTAYGDAKLALVTRIVKERSQQSVLDVGCNTGDVAVAAARAGASVVAVDADVQAIERLWRRARREALDILPLVVDVADPTPARGWRNAERASFLDRATERFDIVVALSVLHHLIAGAGVPLEHALDLLASLTRDRLVLEFVPPSDAHFRRLARGRDELYAGLTQASFEHAVARRFRCLNVTPMPVHGRVMYVLRKVTSRTIS